MYARGMSMRDIQDHIAEMYAIEVSPEPVTDKIFDEVNAWQNRTLESIYPILYLDCLVVKLKENNQITNKSLFLAIGVTMEGQKNCLVCGLPSRKGRSSGYR